MECNYNDLLVQTITKCSDCSHLAVCKHSGEFTFFLEHLRNDLKKWGKEPFSVSVNCNNFFSPNILRPRKAL